MLTLSQRRSMARQGAANIAHEQSAWKATEAVKAEAANRARIESNRAAREMEAARTKLTREDLTDAILVRTSRGWHKVTKVNAKTVSVETGYSWVDRIEFSKIIDTRKPAA